MGPEQIADLSPTNDPNLRRGISWSCLWSSSSSVRPARKAIEHDDETSELVRQHFFSNLFTRLFTVSGVVSGGSLGVV